MAWLLSRPDKEIEVKQTVAEEVFSFSHRTGASTSALLMKIVGTLAILVGCHAAERLSAFGVISWTSFS